MNLFTTKMNAKIRASALTLLMLLCAAAGCIGSDDDDDSTAATPLETLVIAYEVRDLSLIHI